MPCDVVLNAITGSAGLTATLAALRAGRVLALANKESLVVGGPLVTRLAAPGPAGGGRLRALGPGPVPAGRLGRRGRPADPDRQWRTVPGRTREQMADVTPAQALVHPTWSMGRVITTNSATLVNKGLELLEAHLLYGVDLDRIDVVVHPQSIVHSMVQFVDGSTIAQCSPPTMKLPIALGLSWPDRLTRVAPAVDWSTAASWTFEPLDHAGLPRGRARSPGRRPRRDRAGGLQRRQRGMRRRLPRRPDRLPGHLGHRGRRARRAHPPVRRPALRPGSRRRLDVGGQCGSDPGDRARRRRVGPCTGP